MEKNSTLSAFSVFTVESRISNESQVLNKTTASVSDDIKKLATSEKLADDMAMMYLMGVTALIMVFFVCLGLVLSAVNRYNESRHPRRRNRRMGVCDLPPSYTQVAQQSDMLPSYSQACFKHVAACGQPQATADDNCSELSFHTVLENQADLADVTTTESEQTPCLVPFCFNTDSQDMPSSAPASSAEISKSTPAIQSCASIVVVPELNPTSSIETIAAKLLSPNSNAPI